MYCSFKYSLYVPCSPFFLSFTSPLSTFYSSPLFYFSLLYLPFFSSPIVSIQRLSATHNIANICSQYTIFLFLRFIVRDRRLSLEDYLSTRSSSSRWSKSILSQGGGGSIPQTCSQLTEAQETRTNNIPFAIWKSVYSFPFIRLSYFTWCFVNLFSFVKFLLVNVFFFSICSVAPSSPFRLSPSQFLFSSWVLVISFPLLLFPFLFLFLSLSSIFFSFFPSLLLPTLVHLLHFYSLHTSPTSLFLSPILCLPSLHSTVPFFFLIPISLFSSLLFFTPPLPSSPVCVI